MARQLFANNAETTLSGTLSQGGTTMTVASGEGNKFPSITGGNYFYITIFTKDVSGTEENLEIVKVTGRTGDTLTIERDIESITGQAGGLAYNGSTETVYVQMRNTAGTMANNLQAVDIGTTVQAYDANLIAWPGAVTATEVGYLDGVTSAIQTQLDGKHDEILASGILKGDGAGNITAASSGSDYAPATSGSAILKGNGAGGFSSASAGADYQGVISATGILKGAGSGSVSTATVGSDYVAPGTTTTYTAVQNFDASGITLKGSSTGKTTFASANASASNYTVTFPAVTSEVLTKNSYSSGLSALVANSANTPVVVTAAANQSIRVNAGGTAWEAYTPAASAGDVVAANNNAFTGANTFYNATGQAFAPTSLNDGIVIKGRAGGTAGRRIELQTATLTASRAVIFQDVTGTVPLIESPQSWTATQTFKGVTDTVYTITDGAAFEINPANGGIQVVTLGSSRTPAATSFVAGQSVLLGINDGTAFTVTWTTVNPTWVKPGGTGAAPPLATTGYTWVLLWKVGSTIYGAEVGQP